MPKKEFYFYTIDPVNKAYPSIHKGQLGSQLLIHHYNLRGNNPWIGTNRQQCSETGITICTATINYSSLQPVYGKYVIQFTLERRLFNTNTFVQVRPVTAATNDSYPHCNTPTMCSTGHISYMSCSHMHWIILKILPKLMRVTRI